MRLGTVMATAGLLVLVQSSAVGDVITQWDFENFDADATGGFDDDLLGAPSFTVGGQSAGPGAGSIVGTHANPASDWTFRDDAGDNFFASSGWTGAVGDTIRFVADATGFENLSFDFNHRRTGSVQIFDITYGLLAGAAIDPLVSFSPLTASVTSAGLNLTGIEDAAVFVDLTARVVAGASILRLDDVTFSGDVISSTTPVPEPSSVLVLLGMGGGVLVRRRLRQAAAA